MKQIFLSLVYSLLIIPLALAQQPSATVDIIPVAYKLPHLAMPHDASTVIVYEDSRAYLDEFDPEVLPISLIDVASEELRTTLFEGIDFTAAVAVSPDGSVLATSEFNGDIFLWDIETGELLKTIDGLPSQSQMVFIDDNLLVTASANGNIPIFVIWDVVSSVIIRILTPEIGTFHDFIDQRPMQAQSDLTVALIATTDGKELITSTGGDGIFKQDIDSGERRQMRFSDSEYPRLSIRQLHLAPQSDQVFYMLQGEPAIYRLNLDTRVEFEVLSVAEGERLITFGINEATDRLLWLIQKNEALSLYVDNLSDPGNPVEIALPDDIPADIRPLGGLMQVMFSSDGNTAIIGGFSNIDNPENILLKVTFDA